MIPQQLVPGRLETSGPEPFAKRAIKTAGWFVFLYGHIQHSFIPLAHGMPHFRVAITQYRRSRCDRGVRRAPEKGEGATGDLRTLVVNRPST
jgi:hypothetical protein